MSDCTKDVTTIRDDLAASPLDHTIWWAFSFHPPPVDSSANVAHYVSQSGGAILMARKPRPIRIEGSLAFITLTKGYEAVIDADDIPMVEGYHWHTCIQPHTVYAKTNIRHADGVRAALYLHRHLMQAAPDSCVDHRDGNGLNNRRRGDLANLRVATHAENQRNQKPRKQTTSGLKGASQHQSGWRARIMLGGGAVHLGTFKTADDAHAAYCKASMEMHGEFGRQA